MKNYESILMTASYKIDAEKQMASKLLTTRAKTLSAFAESIYEFIEYLNSNYDKHQYDDGYGSGHKRIIFTDMFEFSEYEMGFGIGRKFNIGMANKLANVYLVSHSLNNRIVLDCDDEFNIKAIVGYGDAVKHFTTSDELIQYVAELIICKGLKKL